MDTIEGMRTFVAVAGQASFTGAGQQLGISTKLASKYVRQLEERLGAQLFHRTTRSVTLTETGRAYFERCVPLLEQLDELEGLVQERHSELAGPIRMTAPTAFGSRELVKAIEPFQRQHPKVSIDLHLADHRLGLVEGGFDIAIRFGALQDSTLIARKLLDMRMVVVGSPAYFKERGRPQRPRDLAKHNCLAMRTATDPFNWSFRVKGKQSSVRVQGSFQANSPRAIAYMAAGGVGITRLPFYIARPFLKARELEVIFEHEEAGGFALYAVYPPSRHLTARIRALLDHLAQAIT